MRKLKPCPFCGEKPDIVYCGPGVYVSCCNDDCPCTCEAWGENEDRAEEAWNTRAERTCQIVKTWSDSDYVDDWRYRCSECGRFIPVNERDPETGDVISAANYCPNCGAHVIKSDQYL